MKIISFVNEKGGTLKTTLSFHLGIYTSSYGEKKTLLIDMDPQAHLTRCLGIEEVNISSADVINDPTLSISECVYETRFNNLFVIPASKEISFTLSTLKEKEYFNLKNKLQRTRGFDLTIMDAPPSTGPVSLVVLLTSSHISIPVALNYLSIEGCADIIDTMERVKKKYKLTYPVVSSIVPTLYRRTIMANEIILTLKKHFGKLVILPPIPLSVKVDEAISRGKSIWEYAKTSPIASIMDTVCRKIMKRIQ